MIAEQVGDHGNGVRNHAQLAVAPDGLVLDAEIEGVATEMVVPVEADGGIANGSQQRQRPRKRDLKGTRCRRRERRFSHRLLINGCFHGDACRLRPPR